MVAFNFGQLAILSSKLSIMSSCTNVAQDLAILLNSSVTTSTKCSHSPIGMEVVETSNSQNVLWLHSNLQKHHQQAFLSLEHSTIAAHQCYLQFIVLSQQQCLEPLGIILDVAYNYFVVCPKPFLYLPNLQFFLQQTYILTESTAAFSSSLGIDINLLGTSLDFPSNRLH